MSSLPYLAILGRQPELGLLELESLLGAEGVRPLGRQAALVSRPVELNRLGGVLKLAEVRQMGPVVAPAKLDLGLDGLPRREGKTPFAMSWYGLGASPADLLAAGLELKRRLRVLGSVRLVRAAQGLAVSAAELRHNRVLEDGFELLVVAAGPELVVARTLAVQDIDWYSRRDYERPARSAKVGMLPPKLAQVLLNTTAAPQVADPFCGTGVVLQEALLMGRSVAGSDLAPAMVAASQENLTWLGRQVKATLPAWTVSQADARTVQLASGTAVVSEGYLGPNLTTEPSSEVLVAVRRELQPLYRAALANFARQQGSGDEVAICLPAWRTGQRWAYLDLVDELPDLGYTLKGFQHVRTPLLYARGDQFVGRQLLLLRKK